MYYITLCSLCCFIYLDCHKQSKDEREARNKGDVVVEKDGKYIKDG